MRRVTATDLARTGRDERTAGSYREILRLDRR